MASVTILSSLSQSCMHPAYECAKVASCSASGMQGARRSKPVSTSSYNLLSADKSLQSQFSSHALHLRQEQRLVSAARSTRAELAEDADQGNVIFIEDMETMEKHIAEADKKLVVVDVSTRTCGPCKLIFPKVVKMSRDYPEVSFLKINGDLNGSTRSLMRKWGVRSVPNFRFFRSGELIHSHVGAKQDDLMAHFLKHYESTLKNAKI